MNRLEALRIAKIAYRRVNAAIQEFECENSYEFTITCHWSGCITVGGEFFHEHELKDKNE